MGNPVSKIVTRTTLKNLLPFTELKAKIPLLRNLESAIKNSPKSGGCKCRSSESPQVVQAGDEALSGLKSLSAEQITLIKQTLKVDKLIIIEKQPDGTAVRSVL